MNSNGSSSEHSSTGLHPSDLPRRAVVLVSGGLDSTTCLAIAKAQGYAVYALSFDYGQRHRSELQAAERVAKQLGVIEHTTSRMSGGV